MRGALDDFRLVTKPRSGSHARATAPPSNKRLETASSNGERPVKALRLILSVEKLFERLREFCATQISEVLRV